MKVGIISDSHDHHANVIETVEIFNKQKVQYVFHAGDIISPFTAKAFAELSDAKFIAVFGNCDGEKLSLNSSITNFGGEIYENCFKGEAGGKRIFMTHWPSVIEEVSQSGRFDLVIYGHTHKRDIHWAGKCLVVNPGELTDWVTGQASLVVLELDDMKSEEILLS